MELELKRPEKVNVKLDGVVYPMSKLTMGAALAVEKRLKDEGAEALVSILVERGMPEEVVRGLEVELVEQVIEVLKPSKKA